MNNLDGYVVVITGASGGIGSAIALSLASIGAKLCLIGRNLGRLEGVARSARKKSSQVLVCQADLSSDEEILKVSTDLHREFGQIDVLVHSAGAHFIGSLQSSPALELDALYRANVRSPYVLTQLLIPMLKARQGQIVFVNSSQGLQAGVNVGQFACTQHALKAYADSLREEINPDGVRVLSLYPGRTATPRMAEVYKKEGRAYRPELLLQPEDIAQVVMNALMMPRTAELTNITIRPLVKSY